MQILRVTSFVLVALLGSSIGCGTSGESEFLLKGGCDSRNAFGLCIESYANASAQNYQMSCTATTVTSCPASTIGKCTFPAEGGVYSVHHYYPATAGSGFNATTAASHCSGLSGTFSGS